MNKVSSDNFLSRAAGYGRLRYKGGRSRFILGSEQNPLLVIAVVEQGLVGGKLRSCYRNIIFKLDRCLRGADGNEQGIPIVQ